MTGAKLRTPAVAALWCFLTGAAPSAQQSRTVERDALTITIDFDWSALAAPGYRPIRFDVTNAGGARLLEFVGSGKGFFRPLPRITSAEYSVRQTVHLSPGERVRLAIPVPVFGDHGNVRFDILEGSHEIATFPGRGSFEGRGTPGDSPALIVAESGSAFAATAVDARRKFEWQSGKILVSHGGGTTTTSVSPRGSTPPLDFLLEPERVPASWLAFTSLRAVVVGPTEWKQLHDEQRSALLAWTAAGGDLLLVDGNLATISPAVRGEPATDPVRIGTRYFFGRVQVLSSASFASTNLMHLLTEPDTRDARWALPANNAPDWGALDAQGFRLRIPGVEGASAREVLIFLILVTVLVGGANYWWLRRERRPVLVAISAPVISAVVVILLTGYVIAGAGSGVLGRAMTFTMLDQASHQAATRASVSLYARSSYGGLRFGRDVAVYPLDPNGDDPPDSMSVDLTEAQHFVRGVLQADAPTNFEQVTFRAAQEHLTFTHDASGVSVANGFASGLTALLYRDGASLYRLDAGLPAGATRALTGVPLDGRSQLPAGAPVPAKFLDLVERPPSGSYLAMLDSSPFWESGVSNLTERGSTHLVLGWPEGQR